VNPKIIDDLENSHLSDHMNGKFWVECSLKISWWLSCDHYLVVA